MLETVLQIGKAFRNSLESIQFHRYIRPCPKDSKKDIIVRLNLPVKKDYTFDFNGVSEIEDENIIENKLYYLTFKTSDKDSSTKYIYGDIYYRRDIKKNKESGNFRTIKYSKKDAFKSGGNVLTDLNNQRIKEFREAFASQQDKIEYLFEKYPHLFLHFNFKFSNQYWYDKEELNELNRLMISFFTKKVENENIDGNVFETMLYRTLCSGDHKNDRQFPNFKNTEKYKSRYFSDEEINDLFYGINYTEKPALRPYDFRVGAAKNKIKVIVLPKGENLSAEHYEKYTIQCEDAIKAANESDDIDWLFSPMTDKIASAMTAFDVIFTKQGQNVDTDVIEISGLEKSYIKSITQKIGFICSAIEEEAGRKPFIVQALLNILNDNTKDNKKYQNHLFKVLPKIYMGIYYRDPILLPAFIEKVESNIRIPREFSPNFNSLKFDYHFLEAIQNVMRKGDYIMSVQDSTSYHLGILLGKLARPLKYAINAFEKSYVGTLTRRVATINDLIEFKAFMLQKLILHDRMYPNLQSSSLELDQAIKDFEGRYNKHECAFGFFESYFKPFEGKQSADEEELALNTSVETE